jgi:hypothetical protein
MPTYEVDVGGKTYEVDAPDPNTAWQWANFTNQSAGKPQAKPVVSGDAGFSLGDIAKSFGMGAAGSTKALTDIAGAGNVVSSKLEGATESLQRSLTPERQAEMERQAARMKAAEESGSTWQEIKAGALNVAEAPLQSAAQAIGSFVPYLPAMFAAPVAAAMRLTVGSQAAIRAVAQQAPKVIGTAQGAGAVKGSIYDGVLQAEIEAGVDPELAKKKADAAQSYFGGNFDQIALGGGLGFAAGSSGVEKFLTPAGRAGAAQGMGRRVGEAVIKESLPEAAQGGQERLAQNIGLQREGYDVDTFKGVAGAATQEALTGALGAAPIAALSRPDPTIAPKAEQDKFEQEREEFRKQFGEAKPVDFKEPEAPTEFPGGYTATRRELSRQDVPESFGIFAEGSQNPLTTVKTQEEAQTKLQTLTEIRAEEQARLIAESDKISKDILGEQRKLEVLEATGQTDTDQYVQSKAALLRREEEAAQKIQELNDRIVSYSSPLSFAPVGTRTDVQSDFVVKRGDQEIGAFPTLQDAELKLRELEPETFKQVEQTARVQTDERMQQLKQTLTPMLAKFGLQDVGLNVVEKIENDAGGSYLDSLINISLREASPIQTMRHESLHALKDLQFFTPQQWNVLTERANKQWIKEYLQDQMSEIEVDGKPQTMSRLDAYKRLGYSQEAIVEEAIADAFGAYARGATPPPGMIAALFKKLKNFFMNFGQALRGAGFESADDVFQRVERGELKSRKPKIEKATPEAKEPKEAAPSSETKEKPKYSLAGEGTPMSTRKLMEQQTPVAQQDINLNIEAKRGRFNNVRDIAKALNQQTLDQLGAMDRNNLTQDESTRIAEAIADEVAYQLQTSAKTGTGQGWYSNNYPNAVKRLAKRFPELGTSKHARSVFSALVAVTSNGERVPKNIDNAIKLYIKLRSGKQLVAMGNRRPTALQNNLKAIQDLLTAHGQDFEKVLLKEITVKDMNARLREMGEETDNSYLANTVVPAAAVYFGPKLGAFYANLSGSEGYLTMDLWWTRSINRMRGLLIPKATEASISKFRDMMEQPDATRDEVIAATIPLRNKYEEYGWNSELEHLAGAKEPAKNAAKPAWFRRAEEAAGDAYEQLLFEHNLEKMANTIYKNEFEMLAEAPFTATDRKFMYDAARKAQTLLRNDGIDLSLADIQAALWYYEKRLYAKLSGRKADDIGYEEAIIAQANQGSGRARPSVVFDQKPDSRDEPGAEVAVSDEVRGQPSGGKERLKDGENETIRPDQSAVRPNSRSGEKFALRGERRGQREDSRFTPLPLSPSVKGFHGPDPRIVEVAERYAEKNGIDLKRQAEYVQVEDNKDAEDRATRIAKAYEDMRHDPQNPEVKEAYQNLIDQTISQYKALVDAGYKFWFIDLNNSDNLDYLSSPWNALRDMRSNKQMGIFPTNVGFGSNENFDPSNNPLLQETEFEWPIGGLNGPKQKVLANDVFRAVHDAFGHGLEGAGFRATGEENAWQAHSRLFTGSALKAITSETRGQNSAVNYGPNGEFNRKANPADTIYADQKVGLMPSWTWEEGLSADEPIFQELDSKKDAKRFRDAVGRVKTGRPYAFPLHVHDLDTYKNAKLFLSEDEESGFALIGDEIGSFFSGGRGQAYPTLRLAVDEGGRRIDTYRTKLPSVLGKAHFRPIARVEFNAELATPLWDKNKFKQFQNGKPDLVFYVYDPSFNTKGTMDAGDLAASETPLVDYDEAVALQKESVKDANYFLRGITLGEQQPDAISVKGSHYGKARVSELDASKYGTGIRGSERRRLERTDDERIKKRAYFYIAKPDGSTPTPESGVGQYVYTQKFDNILGQGSKMSRLFLEANGDSNDFESLIVDAGYDGYAIPEMGMMVILNHNVPVNYIGPRSEVGIAKLSLKNVGYPSVKAVKEAVKDAGVPKTNEFKQFIAGNQWNNEDGKPMMFYHATAREFFEFTPAGQSKAIFLATTPEEAETFGSVAEDNLRKEIYEKLLNKDEKLDLFKRVVDAEVEKGSMTTKQGEQFMRQVDRKAPKYGDFGDIEQEVYDALLDLSPTRMSIMPLFARAETPFDFENQDQVERVMQWVANNTEYPQDFPDKWLSGLKGRISQGLWQAIEDKRVQQALRALGHDGFTVREGRNSPKNYAVYTPEQVKSVTGNSGEFSRESKNIKYSLPTIPQQVQDRMGETTTRAQRKTVIQSIVDAIRPTSAADFRAKYLNRYNQMSVYDKKRAEQMGGAALLADQSAESAALMSDLGAGVAASAMGYDDRNGGIPVLRNGITTIDKRVKGMVASLAPLAEKGDPAIYQRYQYWAMVKRGQRLNSQGKLTGIDSADVAFARILEKAHPEFVNVQKDLVAFNNGLVQYMVDTGVLSKERGQIYTKYADYIPFYRQMDGDQTLGPNLFQSLSGVKPPKKLKGAVADEAPLADFLETMVRNTQSSIQAGIKNYAAQRALSVAVQVQAPGMGAVRLNTKENGPDIINVLEKGNLVSYRTPDPLLVNAMMSLNQSELPFMGFLSAPADWLRTLVTKEPGFMMANMMRDSLSAWVTSGQKMTPIAGTVINFGKAIARTSPGFEAMLDAGIIGGYEFNENIEQSGFKLEDDLAKKAGKKAPLVLRPFKSVWDALGKGTTASDAATRALIYERVLADTGNEAEALYRSLEVMNFHRKGSSPLIRVLTAAVPFFNARLQGLDLFYRASTGNMNNKDAASIQRQFFARGMTMMALSGLYWMLVSDDEEYKKQEQETKDNNWIIPAIGAKIPIPFEVGVLFKVIPERIMAYSFGSDTGEDLQKSMIRAAVSTFAFNPIPQTVKPILEAVVDYNMFTMRPILGQGMKDIEPEFQVGPSTSNFATVLAQSLGLSPMKVDHIIKGYTGTMGMYAIDTIDMVMDQFGDSPKPTKRFEQLPIIKRFASDPEARGYVTQYYELKDAVDTTVRTMNLLEKTNQPEEYVKYVLKNQGTLAFKDYISDTEKSMKDLREMRVAIRSSTMGGDEKRDALLAISQMESALTSNIQEIKKTIASVQ